MAPRTVRPGERGIALVAALSVMVLMAAASLAFVIASSTETRMVTSQRIEHNALWRAESGTKVARQMVSTFARTKLDSLAAAWSGNGPIVTDTAAFFPAGGFSYAPADSSYTANIQLEFDNSSMADSAQIYNYRYTSTARGFDGEYGEKQVIAEGILRVSASRGSFTDYLIFTDVHTTEWGGAIWFHTSGVFDGSVHTNTQYRFAYYPTFYDAVSSVAETAIYYNEGSPVELDADFNGTSDVPNFGGGFERDVPEIEMPTNAFGQQRAALGGDPSDTSPVTNAEARTLLGLPPGGDPVPDGVYVPNNGSDITGGLYVAGDAREMRLELDGSGNQVYKIKDDNNNWTTITVNESAGTTTVDAGGSPVVYQGVPRGVTYTDGDVDRLGGPPRSGEDVVPAVAAHTEMTVVSSGNLRIDRDIAYEDYDNGSQVLGLYSGAGSVQIREEAPDEVMIDGFVMAGGNEGVFTVENYWEGEYRGQLHLRGGVVQRYYGAFGTFGGGGMTGFGRNWTYDTRGIVPPYYPTTTRYTVDEPSPAVLAWRED